MRSAFATRVAAGSRNVRGGSDCHATLDPGSLAPDVGAAKPGPFERRVTRNPCTESPLGITGKDSKRIPKLGGQGFGSNLGGAAASLSCAIPRAAGVAKPKPAAAAFPG
jgi:hypothetical protein